jgi:hypothetical protein
MDCNAALLQDLERLFPNIVFSSDVTSSDGATSSPSKSVLYNDLIAVLTVALQDQQARNSKSYKKNSFSNDPDLKSSIDSI